MKIKSWLPILLSSSIISGFSHAEPQLNAQQVVELLDLEAHIEGGYFKQTYKAETKIDTVNGERVTMTSLFYMLTEDSPMGQFHINKSDIVHYYQAGNPIEYIFIKPDGELETHILGPDISSGQVLQLIVPGGYWKAARLVLNEHTQFDFGLIGDAVAPGFEYHDMQIAKSDELTKQFPQHKDLIQALTLH